MPSAVPGASDPSTASTALDRLRLAQARSSTRRISGHARSPSSRSAASVPPRAIRWPPSATGSPGRMTRCPAPGWVTSVVGRSRAVRRACTARGEGHRRPDLVVTARDEQHVAEEALDRDRRGRDPVGRGAQALGVDGGEGRRVARPARRRRRRARTGAAHRPVTTTSAAGAARRPVRRRRWPTRRGSARARRRRPRRGRRRHTRGRPRPSSRRP